MRIDYYLIAYIKERYDGLLKFIGMIFQLQNIKYEGFKVFLKQNRIQMHYNQLTNEIGRSDSYIISTKLMYQLFFKYKIPYLTNHGSYLLSGLLRNIQLFVPQNLI